MQIINCAIIEDEPLGAKSLEALLKAGHPEIRVLQFAKTLEEASKVFGDKSINLYFTDIELLDGNIFEVLKDIQMPKGKYIIFTTAYEEFGASAFSYPALHYLMKPINPNELEKAINRYKDLAFNQTGRKSNSDSDDEISEITLNRLVLPTQNGTIFLDIDSIIRVQSANKYSILFTTSRKQYVVTNPLSKFEAALGAKGFLRIHDSHIVNVKHVFSITKGKVGEIIMSDESHVPLSHRKKEALIAMFRNNL
jgi:two-component system LytT family response regulator